MSGAPTQSSPSARVLVPLLVGVFVRALPFTLFGPLLPGIAASLGVDLAGIGWVIAAYALAAILVQPIAGALADARGRKRAFMWSLAIFITGSCVSAFATTLPVLIAGRIVQALGAGGLQPIAVAILARASGADRRGGSLGLLGATIGVAAVVGSVLGAALATAAAQFHGGDLARYPWHAVFWLNVALGAIALVTATWLPGDDLPQTAAALAHEPTARGWLRGGVPLLLLLVTLAALPASSLTIFSAAYFITAFGASQLQAGLALMVLALAYSAAAAVGGVAIRAAGEIPVLALGLGVLAAGAAWLAADAHPVRAVLALGVGGIGIGLLTAPPWNLLLRYIDEARSGTASGVMSMLASSGAVTAPLVVSWVLAGGAAQANSLRLEFAACAVIALACASLALALPRPARAR